MSADSVSVSLIKFINHITWSIIDSVRLMKVHSCMYQFHRCMCSL